MKPKILIVDDDVDSWRLLQTICAPHYEVTWAADGIQAMSTARKHQPSVILLDLGLPGGDGLLVLERLKTNHLVSAIPVVVVTVRDSLQMEPRTRKLGAVAFIQKPVQGDQLLTAIREALEKSPAAEGNA